MDNLDLQQLQTLFYILLGLIVLLLVVLTIYVVIANRRQRTQLEKTVEEAKLAPRQIQQITGQILSLIRDDVGGAIHIEIAGAEYYSMEEVDDPNLKRQVVAAAMELIQFTGVLAAGATEPAPIDGVHRWREDMRGDSSDELVRLQGPVEDQTEEPRTPAASGEVEEQFLNLLTEMGQAPQPPEKPGLVSSIQHAWTPKQGESNGPRTFVDEIEAIIQRRIQLIPALADCDIHVQPGPGGSVRFVFEGHEYKNLDEVPNMTARTLIQDSIREWDETT
jgi:hypothetical protein